MFYLLLPCFVPCGVPGFHVGYLPLDLVCFLFALSPPLPPIPSFLPSFPLSPSTFAPPTLPNRIPTHPNLLHTPKAPRDETRPPPLAPPTAKHQTVENLENTKIKFPNNFGEIEGIWGQFLAICWRQQYFQFPNPLLPKKANNYILLHETRGGPGRPEGTITKNTFRGNK